MTNFKKIFFIAFIITSFIGQWAFAEIYKYSELELKNYDDMRKMVQERVKKASEIDANNQQMAEDEGRLNYDETESILHLEDALKLILSRPNKDNMIEKLLPDVRGQLNNYGAYYDSLNNIVIEAINGVSQKIPVVYKSTYIFILENIMSEHRPYIKKENEVKKIFMQIRDAKIEVPNDVRLDRKLRSMFKSQSPSKTASEVLRIDFPEEHKKKGFWEKLFGLWFGQFIVRAFAS